MTAAATLASADVYTDLHGLATLRRKAAERSPEALRMAAVQFEALLMQMMLKSMRAASFGDPLLGSSQGDLYRDMFDQQLALTLSKHGGMGLAEVMVRQLSADFGGAADSSEPREALSPLVAYRARSESALRRGPAAAGTAEEAEGFRAASKSAADVAESVPEFGSPRQFVAAIWPHAERAAAALGVRPEALVAQAALETGWGQHILRHPDGSSSFNLFGIKAGTRWRGARVTAPTLEFIAGVIEKRREEFRAYGSFAESFRDYVDLLQSHPRYRGVLRSDGDAGAFARALQEAGYATDPRYADKIQAIVRSTLLEDAVDGLTLPGRGGAI